MNNKLTENDSNEYYVQVMDVNGMWDYYDETYLISDTDGEVFSTDEKDYDSENSRNTFTIKWLKEHWDRYYQFENAKMLKYTKVG